MLKKDKLKHLEDPNSGSINPKMFDFLLMTWRAETVIY